MSAPKMHIRRRLGNSNHQAEDAGTARPVHDKLGRPL